MSGSKRLNLIAYESMRAIDNELWQRGTPMRYGLRKPARQ